MKTKVKRKQFNNQGFTVVELVVAFALTMIITIFLFQLLIQAKEIYVSGGLKTELSSKQSLITKTIGDDLNKKKIMYATNCGQYCLNFTFEDGSTKQLKVDTQKQTIRYGTYAIKLVKGSKFGKMRVSTESPSMSNIASMMNHNAFIQINIPITHPLFKENYGVSLVYQYNSYETPLNNVVFTGNGQTESLYLNGLSEMVMFQSEAYQEPGYFVINASGQRIENDPRVTVNCNVGKVAGTTYTCTYSFYNSGKLVNSRTRKITVIP